MRRAKEKERFENAGGSAEALARVAMQKAVDDRPEPAIFAKNRALINLPKVRKRPPVAPPAKRIKTHRLLPLAPEDERVGLARRPP